MRLRAATRADIPALAELVRAADLSQRAWAGPDLPVAERHEQELAWDLHFARRGAWAAVAEDEDGALVGVVAYAGATRADRTPLPGVAHISAVFVHPSRWRRGIAQRLLARAEDAMRAEGYRQTQLWTLAGSPAEQVYARLGWHPDGRRDLHQGMKREIVGYAKELDAAGGDVTRT